MRSPKTCRTRYPCSVISLLSVLQLSDNCRKRPNEYKNSTCQQIRFTNGHTLNETHLSVDQYLNGTLPRGAPALCISFWCAGLFRWSANMSTKLDKVLPYTFTAYKIKRHDHLQLLPTVAVVSSGPPHCPPYPAGPWSYWSTKTRCGRSGAHTVSNKRVPKQTRCIYIYMHILHILDECSQVFPGDAYQQNQTHRCRYHPSINWVCKNDKVRLGKLERILPWIKFQMHFLWIHRNETHKSTSPMKANGWKIVQQGEKTWSSNFKKRCTGKLSAKVFTHTKIGFQSSYKLTPILQNFAHRVACISPSCEHNKVQSFGWAPKLFLFLWRKITPPCLLTTLLRMGLETPWEEHPRECFRGRTERCITKPPAHSPVRARGHGYVILLTRCYIRNLARCYTRDRALVTHSFHSLSTGFALLFCLLAWVVRQYRMKLVPRSVWDKFNFTKYTWWFFLDISTSVCSVLTIRKFTFILAALRSKNSLGESLEPKRDISNKFRFGFEKVG